MVRGMGAVGSMRESLADWGGGEKFRIQSSEFRMGGRRYHEDAKCTKDHEFSPQSHRGTEDAQRVQNLEYEIQNDGAEGVAR